MIFLLWRGRMIVKQTSRSSLSSSSGSVRIELKPKIVNIDLGAEEELPIRKTPSAERWGNVRTPLLTKMQESGCAFHHRKPEVKILVYIGILVMLDNKLFCKILPHSGPTWEFQPCLKSRNLESWTMKWHGF